MRRCLMALGTVTATMLLGLHPGAAYTEGPWCAVSGLGEGAVSERCDFQDFASCQREVTGGNRGFCNHNPRWSGPSHPSERVSPRRRARR
jgi:hypothetical protein